MLAYNPSTEEVETRTGAVGQSATSNLCVPVRNNVDNSRGIKPKVAHKPVCTQTCDIHKEEQKEEGKEGRGRRPTRREGVGGWGLREKLGEEGQREIKDGPISPFYSKPGNWGRA